MAYISSWKATSLWLLLTCYLIFFLTLVAFQKVNVNLSLIQPCLQTTIDTISKYKDTAGPNLSKVDEVLSTELKDFNIVATSAQKEASWSEIQVKYIDSLVNHLKDLFPHVELLGAFSIFDPQNVPSDEEQLTT